MPPVLPRVADYTRRARSLWTWHHVAGPGVVGIGVVQGVCTFGKPGQDSRGGEVVRTVESDDFPHELPFDLDLPFHAGEGRGDGRKGLRVQRKTEACSCAYFGIRCQYRRLIDGIDLRDTCLERYADGCFLRAGKFKLCTGP